MYKIVKIYVTLRQPKSNIQSAEWPYSALNGLIVDLNTLFNLTSFDEQLHSNIILSVIPIKKIDTIAVISIQIHYKAN